ncbi:hypothetical protein EGW08_005663 [Elysia chlorotica]|uniref:2'-phosphotransferase n=1 Tax=Elysia chlorotica TaxID=188477 RepID=A0A433TYE3_ELYCH|nr:hypothetical protein EGW08_005663 [Elysia chlorotica]
MASGLRPVDAVKISKALSYTLRHGAEKEGFTLLPGGYLYLDDILQKKRFHMVVTVEDIQAIVDTNDKQRFTMILDEETQRLKICANQGHSLQVDDLDLRPVENGDDFRVVVHGTYYKYWKFIAHEGLKRMNRNHIHFAAGLPSEDGVISGGLKFFISSNNVILSPGNESGIIDPQFFEKVVDRKSGRKLQYPGSDEVLEGDSGEIASGVQSMVVTADNIDDEFQKKSRRKKKNKKGLDS